MYSTTSTIDAPSYFSFIDLETSRGSDSDLINRPVAKRFPSRSKYAFIRSLLYITEAEIMSEDSISLHCKIFAPENDFSKLACSAADTGSPSVALDVMTPNVRSVTSVRIFFIKLIGLIANDDQTQIYMYRLP